MIRRPLEVPSRCSTCGETAAVQNDGEFMCGKCFRERSIKRYAPAMASAASAKSAERRR